MKTFRNSLMLYHERPDPERAHSIDKIGVFVALAFLIGIFFVASGNREKTPEVNQPRQTDPAPDKADFRQAAVNAFPGHQTSGANQ